MMPNRWDATWTDASLGTELYYNVHRWYEPQTGRYTRVDPLGLLAGDNLFAYSLGNPVRYQDPLGLSTFVCERPLAALPGEGERSGPEWTANPFYHQFYCVTTANGFECHGQSGDRFWGPGRETRSDEDFFQKDRCTPVRDTDDCFDECMQNAGSQPRPDFGLFGVGTNCKEWTGDTIIGCREQCGWPDQSKTDPAPRDYKFSRQ